MGDPDMTASKDGDVSIVRIMPAIFCISFAAIGWQLVLMRCLLISRYHHFSFLIISCALLGFGAAGSVLALFRQWFERNAERFFRWGTLSFALSMPVCFRVGGALPLNVYFPPAQLESSLAWWVVFWLIHVIPFLLAGLLIGLALMGAGIKVNRVYAVNLAGSATGALGAMLLLQLGPANLLAIPLALVVAVSCFFLDAGLQSRPKWAFGALLCLATTVLAGLCFVDADRWFPLNIDQYKPLAYVQQLEKQGDATRISVFHGPRGRIELFRGSHFHTVMSLSSRETPPAMDLLVRDGFPAGSVISIQRPEEARFLRGSLSALPYELIHPERVLILGDASGIYVWLARMSSARSIVLVHPDANIIAVLKNHPSRVLEDPRVQVVLAEPRAFLDSTPTTFDIIHLAAMEGFAAGSAGIGGLREDYLATVQGFAACLRRLTPHGLGCVIRGIQDPARDNIKIPATWIEAMESLNLPDPGGRILMARDELNCVTLAGRSAVGAEVVAKFGETCRSMSWEQEWLPGVLAEDTNRIHVLPGPPGTKISWYHRAMEEILSPRRESFYRDWICDIRPATDNRPFFHDFFRWASVSTLRQAFGPIWPARSEMGFLVLIMATIWTSLAAIVLLPAPIWLLRRGSEAVRSATILRIIVYFGCLGCGFMFVEMSYIQLFTRFLGDPVAAAALVLGGFLLFVGVGSLAQPLVTAKLPWGVLVPAGAVALLALFNGVAFPMAFEAAAGWPLFWKIMAGVAMMAPVAFFMGMPFPWGLSILHATASAAIPLAWAVNGFASVISACGAVLLAMASGFEALSLIAACIYGVAGMVSVRLRS